MDADFSQKLSQILSDPTALDKIKSIAEGMSLGQSAPPVSEPTALPSLPVNTPQTPESFRADFALGSDPRLALLTAIKPLLREDKRDRVDTLTKAMTVMMMLKNLK